MTPPTGCSPTSRSAGRPEPRTNGQLRSIGDPCVTFSGRRGPECRGKTVEAQLSPEFFILVPPIGGIAFCRTCYVPEQGGLTRKYRGLRPESFIVDGLVT